MVFTSALAWAIIRRRAFCWELVPTRDANYQHLKASVDVSLSICLCDNENQPFSPVFPSQVSPSVLIIVVPKAISSLASIRLFYPVSQMLIKVIIQLKGLKNHRNFWSGVKYLGYSSLFLYVCFTQCLQSASRIASCQSYFIITGPWRPKWHVLLFTRRALNYMRLA